MRELHPLTSGGREKGGFLMQGTVCSVSIPLGNGVVQEEWSAEHTAQGDPLSQLSSAPEDIQKGWITCPGLASLMQRIQGSRMH